jgi:hypothetical protein
MGGFSMEEAGARFERKELRTAFRFESSGDALPLAGERGQALRRCS